MVIISYENNFISIYRDSIDKNCVFGQITNFSSEYIYMNIFEDGSFNGYAIMRMCDVTRIRLEKKESESMLLLASRNNKNPKYHEINIKLDLLKDILVKLDSFFDMISISIEEVDIDMCFIGNISEISEDYLVLHEYRPIGNSNRSYILIRLNDITLITWNNRYLNNLSSLYHETN